jgi:hypothetical protein
MHSIWSQCNKTVTQQQKQQQKICKHLEAEEHIAQWSVSNRRNKNWMKLKCNENENTNQNLWDTAKAVLRGKFIAMSAYTKRTERSQLKDLMLHLKLQEKQEQAKPKTSRRRE